MLVSRLTKSTWSAIALDDQILSVVLSRSWNFKLQALTIKNLIRIKPGRGPIKTDLFT